MVKKERKIKTKKKTKTKTKTKTNRHLFRLEIKKTILPLAANSLENKLMRQCANAQFVLHVKS
jgi:hypothetical protein